MLSNKQKVMGISPNTTEVRCNNVNMHIQVKKKNLNGEKTITYTLCDNYDGKDVPVEYSNLDNFVEKCLKPTLEKARKALA